MWHQDRHAGGFAFAGEEAVKVCLSGEHEDMR